ncbi:hypothetical protein [Devosia sp.]|uniref:hypothetical protein n=1 Tax=Devosia sp. TaxID=1871048 RepID=UPI003A8EDF8A
MSKRFVMLSALALLLYTGAASAAQFRDDGSFVHYEYPPPEMQRTATGLPSFVILPGAPGFLKVTRRHYGAGSAGAAITDDRNCDSFAGPVQIVNGNDPYNLDADNDGIGCE